MPVSSCLRIVRTMAADAYGRVYILHGERVRVLNEDMRSAREVRWVHDEAVGEREGVAGAALHLEAVCVSVAKCAWSAGRCDTHYPPPDDRGGGMGEAPRRSTLRFSKRSWDGSLYWGPGLRGRDW